MQAVGQPGIADLLPAHPAAFEDVQSQIRTKLNGEKLQQLLTQKGNELLAKTKAAGDLKMLDQGLDVRRLIAGAVCPKDRPDDLDALVTKRAAHGLFVVPGHVAR